MTPQAVLACSLLENQGKSSEVVMKHVFSVVGLGMVAVFVAVFLATRVGSEHLDSVAQRIGIEPPALHAMGTRVSSQTGATVGTSRRVVYLLACSGVPTAETIEAKAIEAAFMSERQRLTAREAASTVLAGSARTGSKGRLDDC